MSESAEAWVAAGVHGAIAKATQAQDAGRADDIVALYTSDGILEVPGIDPIAGHDALREAFKQWTPTLPQKHLVANTVITSWTENEATAVSDTAFFQRGESGWAIQVAGRYVDSLVHRDGEWLFQRRTTTYSA